MKIEDVPEGNWMLLNNQREVLFHSSIVADVMHESRRYAIGDVTIEKKITGIFFGIKE